MCEAVRVMGETLAEQGRPADPAAAVRAMREVFEARQLAVGRLSLRVSGRRAATGRGCRSASHSERQLEPAQARSRRAIASDEIEWPE